MLTTVDVKGVQVTADQVGHFAVHPAIMRHNEAGEFFLCADTWVIHHLPSKRDLMMLHESDPIEFPGNPLAINLDVVREFLTWLDQFADWSKAEPQPEFPTDADKQAYRLFSTSPVFWERPKVPTT